MRIRIMPGRGMALRAALRAAVWCVMCTALLTCTPPNFGGDPEPDPLVLSPISASIYVGPSLTITISSGGSTDVTKNVAPSRTRIGTRTTPTRASPPYGKKSGMLRRE